MRRLGWKLEGKEREYLRLVLWSLRTISTRDKTVEIIFHAQESEV